MGNSHTGKRDVVGTFTSAPAYTTFDPMYTRELRPARSQRLTPRQMKRARANWKARKALGSMVAIKIYLVIVAVVLGAVMGYFVVVPYFRNMCIWFDRRCQTLTYYIMPGGSAQLLVIDPLTGNNYWFDGNFIHAYGATLQGTCPKMVTTGATGEQDIVGSKIDLCARVKPDGTACAAWLKNYIPKQFAGKITAQGDIFEPAFVLNAYRMQVVDGQIWCSRKFALVQSDFASSGKEYKIRYHLDNKHLDALDVYQVFDVLEKRGVFQRPLQDPEAPPCNGHGTLDPSTFVCMCDEGYVGSECYYTKCKPGDCGENGTCNAQTGLCTCKTGYTGNRCEGLQCPGSVPGNCYNNGTCNELTGKCKCNPGYGGDFMTGLD